ncbi:MAG: c-type cytochrome [Bryobacteraceae bacterium]
MNWKHIILTSLVFGGGLFAVLVWGQNQETNAAEPDHLIGSIEGPALYKAYCAVCHGADAKGDGPMAKSLKASPADLTHISARNGGLFPTARLRRVISGEDPIAAGHGTREMPVWGPIFSQVERDQDLGRVRIDNLTKYLEKLQAK